eukprot:scaffold17817_cov33-Tisochrysis_lutea.AAC.3
MTPVVMAEQRLSQPPFTEPVRHVSRPPSHRPFADTRRAMLCSPSQRQRRGQRRAMSKGALAHATCKSIPSREQRMCKLAASRRHTNAP